MISTIITSILCTLSGTIIGYLTKTLIKYKKRDDSQNKAIRNMLKSNLVNQFYVYDKIGTVPRYIKESWYDMFESYTELGGNSFVKHDIEPKFSKLKIDD